MRLIVLLLLCAFGHSKAEAEAKPSPDAKPHGHLLSILGNDNYLPSLGLGSYQTYAPGYGHSLFGNLGGLSLYGHQGYLSSVLHQPVYSSGTSRTLVSPLGYGSSFGHGLGYNAIPGFGYGYSGINRLPVGAGFGYSGIGLGLGHPGFGFREGLGGYGLLGHRLYGFHNFGGLGLGGLGLGGLGLGGIGLGLNSFGYIRPELGYNGLGVHRGVVTHEVSPVGYAHERVGGLTNLREGYNAEHRHGSNEVSYGSTVSHGDSHSHGYSKSTSGAIDAGPSYDSHSPQHKAAFVVKNSYDDNHH